MSSASPGTPTRRGSPNRPGTWWWGERPAGIRFLIRDRDSKFSGPFDEVFRTEAVKVSQPPIRSPRANAFAERVRTVRAECLDWTLVLGRRHLERVLRAYTAHYNEARPNRGLDLRTPEPRPDPPSRPAFGTRIEGEIYWVDSSMNTNSLPEAGLKVSAPYCPLHSFL